MDGSECHVPQKTADGFCQHEGLAEGAEVGPYLLHAGYRRVLSAGYQYDLALRLLEERDRGRANKIANTDENKSPSLEI